MAPELGHTEIYDILTDIGSTAIDGSLLLHEHLHHLLLFFGEDVAVRIDAFGIERIHIDKVVAHFVRRIAEHKIYLLCTLRYAF